MAYRDEKFSERLKNLIKVKGLNNDKIAKIVGLAPPTIGKYVNNGRVPDDTILNKIADALGTTSQKLRYGEKALETAGESVKDNVLDYIVGDPEEQHQVNKLIEILRHGTDGERKILVATINVLCGDRLWKSQGSPERRKKQTHEHGQPERRLKIHAYS